MIRFVKHTDIRPEKWDEAILRSQSPTVLATHGFLDTLTAGSTWNALILDDYAAVLPLPERSKMGIPYIYTPFFLPQLGIFSPTPTNAETTLAFFNNIPTKYKQIDLLLNATNDAGLLKNETIQLVSHQLSLQKPYEQLQADFSQNTRRNIKDAQKHSLTYFEDEMILDDVINLFKQNKGREKNVHYGNDDYPILQKAAQKLIDNQKLLVAGVLNANEKLVAGAFFLHDYTKIHFWFSGRDDEASEGKPMFFLLDEYIHRHAGSDKILDFNGSSNPNVARLYRGFGGMPYSIPMIHHTPTLWQLPMRIYRFFSK